MSRHSKKSEDRSSCQRSNFILFFGTDITRKIQDIFEEIPVALKTSHLANMLIFDLEERNPINPEKTVLEPATSASLERHMK